MIFVAYVGLLLVLLVLWPVVLGAWHQWQKGTRRVAAAGLLAYCALAAAFAVYQFLVR